MPSLPLTEKYRPQSFTEIKGQDLAIAEIKIFLKTFPKKKAIVLNGPVGTGKTSIAIALAKEFNLELFELNASDLRNRSKLEEVLKPATAQKSLFKKGKLILMDEADGITGSDRGGLPELIALIEKTKHPIIITANDIWQRKFSLLRKKCQMADIKELKDEIILEILKNVLEKEEITITKETKEENVIPTQTTKPLDIPDIENINIENQSQIPDNKIKQETINTITKKSRGDARAALNDLQTILTLGEQVYISEEVEREKQDTIFNALKEIFQEQTNEKTISAYNSTNLDLNEILLWVEENIPLEYQGQALAKAYDSLSKADLFKGRIYRQQYWRFLVYQNFFLSAGISASTKLKYKKFTKYQRPTRILKIWLSNQKNAKKKSITIKYSKHCHLSKKKANKEAFLFPLILNSHDKNLDLDEKEKTWLEDKREGMIVENELRKFR